MEFETTDLRDVVLVRPRVFEDGRGFFMEAWQERKFADAGIHASFVQDNCSRSKYGVVRGLHYQLPHAQGKLIYVTSGVIFDVAVDLRAGSPTFGQWQGLRLDAERHEMLWIPEGFAHGFLTLSKFATVLYKATDFWYPQGEHTLSYADPALGIDWPLPDAEVVLNEKDRLGKPFTDCPKFR